MIGAHRAIATIDRCALDHRQQVTLNALARDIRPMRRRRTAYLVQLIDENNPLQMITIFSIAVFIIMMCKQQEFLMETGALGG